MRNLKLLATAILSTLSLQSLEAGVSHALQNTATTLQPGKYQARAQGDFLLSRGGGVNVSGHMRAGLIEDMLDVEAYAGTGKTNFKIGVQTKFNLLPDLPGQVGLGFVGGYTYILDDFVKKGDSDSINLLHFAAVVSKKFPTTFGSITPYGGIQFELLFSSEKDVVPVTGIIGSEWGITSWEPVTIFSEFDIDFSKSIFMLSLGGAYYF